VVGVGVRGDDGAFRGWYVNLESVHERRDHEVVTQDHVLDLVVQPDRSVVRKDEDELAAAVRAGRFSAAEAAAIVGDAAAVEDVVRRWASPFCDGWETWAPDPTWPLPELPPAYVAKAAYR
jgi:predicted RNA-binding protein associated with RNAse of E/G family